MTTVQRNANKGMFGNPAAKNCKHVFTHGNWKHSNCIKCNAKDKKDKKVKFKTKLHSFHKILTRR